MKIENGIGWKRDSVNPEFLISCDIADYVAEIKRLRAALDLIRTTGPARHYEIAEKALGLDA